eukprot:3654542-Pleurochrysis_carterae.AAC.8
MLPLSSSNARAVALCAPALPSPLLGLPKRRIQVYIGCCVACLLAVSRSRLGLAAVCTGASAHTGATAFLFRPRTPLRPGAETACGSLICAERSAVDRHARPDITSMPCVSCCDLCGLLALNRRYCRRSFACAAFT